MKIVKVAWFIVEADTTLNANISPAVIDVVQVDKLKSSFFVEDDNVGMQEKVAIGKEAYDSVSTLEKDILTVTKEYGVNIKDKPASKDNSSQTKLF